MSIVVSLFCRTIGDLLADFGVQIKKIGRRKEQTNADGSPSYRLRLVLSGTNENLIKLWEQIGFEYNTERKTLANIALQYLKLKQQVIEDRENAAEIAVAMHADGLSVSEITYKIGSEYINERFVERVYEGRRMEYHGAAKPFQLLRSTLKKRLRTLDKSGMVWDCIESIIPIEFDDYVYDFTVDHLDHNFIANGFVVSNCGVALNSDQPGHQAVSGQNQRTC